MGKRKTKKPAVFDAERRVRMVSDARNAPVLADSRLNELMFDGLSIPQAISMLQKLVEENHEFENVYFDVHCGYSGHDVDFLYRHVETDDEFAERKRVFDEEQATRIRLEHEQREKEIMAAQLRLQAKKAAQAAAEKMEYEQYLVLKKKFASVDVSG